MKPRQKYKVNNKNPNQNNSDDETHILSRQESANRNRSEIPPQPSQKG